MVVEQYKKHLVQLVNNKDEINELSIASNDEINKFIIRPNSNHAFIQKIVTIDLNIKCFEWINKCILKNMSFYSSHI